MQNLKQDTSDKVDVGSLTSVVSYCNRDLLNIESQVTMATIILKLQTYDVRLNVQG